jgi:Zn finger protein HypA/HybF involved in hydrogenase expression
VASIQEIFDNIKKTFSVNAANRDLQQEAKQLLRAYKEALSNGRDISRFVTADLWQDHQMTRERMQKLGVSFREYSVATKESEEFQEGWSGAMTLSDGKNLSTGVLDGDNRHQDYTSAHSVLKTKDKYNRKYVFVSSIVLQDKRVICPACGEPNMREILYAGCPFCRTKFNIHEFDNKLAHIIPEALGKREIFRVIKLAVAITILIALICAVAWQSLWALAFSPLLFILGYLLATLISLPRVINGTRKAHITRKLQWEMQKVDEHFSYDHFLGTVQHRLKVWALSDDRNLLSLTSGLSAGDQSIVDVDVVEYRGTEFRGNLVVVKAEVVLVTCTNGKLRKEHKNIAMTLFRNPHTKTKLHIDFERLKCATCGASIRISDGALCLYCRNPVDVRNYDWIVVEMKTRKPSIFQKIFG